MRYHDCFSKVEAEALRLNDELWLDTICFFRNANEIYRRFEEWKGIDRFYFIPLKLNMAYSINGYVVRIAEDPIYLGTFVRNTLEHPEMFSFKCPRCGKTVYPYGYNGSPLSGRVDLQGVCECGWSDYVMVSGWRKRSDALKETQREDRFRLAKFKALRCVRGGESSVVELKKWLENR